MSDVIFKYEADEGGQFHVPAGEVVLVAQQGLNTGDIFPKVWIRHDHEAVPDTYLRIVGTGHFVGDDEVCVGSAVCGIFVWHVVKVVEPT